MRRIHIDFETQSACDLKERGSDNYFKHPSTKVLCMAYAIDDRPVQLWKNGILKPFSLWNTIVDGAEIWAHNSAFEFGIWNNVCVPKYGWPPLKPEQMYCTMSMAAAMGLPQSLENAALACGLSQQKDVSARRIMLTLSQPKRDGTFYEYKDDPEKFEKLYAYCKQDVEVERALAKRLTHLSPKERSIWLIDQRINQRGICIDVGAAKKLQALVADEQERLDERMRHLTGQMVPGVNATARLKAWMKEKGVEVESIDKANVLSLFNDPSVPKNVIDALLVRQEAAKSSNAKYAAMLNLENGGRARHLFQYYGAGTGRWAGRKIQLQNLPRSKLKQEEIEDAIRQPKAIPLFHMSTMQVASDCIRGMFVPSRDKIFYAADYSNIEGRGLAWLAGEEWKLKAFRDFDVGTGSDIYKLSYARAFHKNAESVTSDERQIGKVMELALGYGGGIGAFQTMARGYGVTVPDEKADELKTAWRDAHPKTVSYWYALEEAAMQAIVHPGETFQVGKDNRKILYVKKGSFLCCKLPSGRVMFYPYPKVEDVETPWGELKQGITYMSQDSQTKKWARWKTYGGSLCENICQAICRDILAEAMLRLEKAGYEIVCHVHDEVVAEVSTTDKKFSLKDFEKIMSDVPEWAKDFPIVAKGWSGFRYRKG